MSQITVSTLPPGPRLPKWLQTIVLVRYWPRFVSACGRRYGKVFTIRAATIPPMVFLADPAEIKKVFAGDPGVFHAGEANAMLAGRYGIRGGAEGVRDHAGGDPANRHRGQRPGPARCAAGRDAEAAQRRNR